MTENIYIPIGFQCTTAEILKKTNKRLCSFPFDWIISNPESIVKLLTILLEEKCNIPDFVKEEFLKIDGLLHFLKQEEFVLHPQGNILFNSKYNLIFPHINYNNEIIEKFIKRFNRLKNYILCSSNKIIFLFVNRLINDEYDNNIIKFSINNKNIDLNIKDNFTQLNTLLLKYIPSDRFNIIIINAVKKINDFVFDKNIIYKEIIPINNSNLTDEEIIQIIQIMI